MKKALVLFGALIISLNILTAQNSDKFTGALLWKITGNGLDKPSYIVGTHHLASIEFIDNIPGLRKTMKDVDQIAGEILMNDMDAIQTKMQNAAIMPNGITYKKLLSTEEYDRLDKGLKNAIGAGLDQVGGFKPGILSSLYSIIIYAQLSPGFDPKNHEPIDLYIQRYATENGKPVIGLETIEDQIHVLYDTEPLKDQAINLACQLNNPDFAKENLIKLNKYYADKDLIKIYELAFENTNDPCQSSNQIQQALNKNRNDNWIAKLPAIMKSKSTLIAVGVLHLAGKDGLLEQLDKLGYIIEAVK